MFKLLVRQMSTCHLGHVVLGDILVHIAFNDVFFLRVSRARFSVLCILRKIP